MRLNGESEEQMAHVKAIKAAGGVSLDPADGCDTSKDQKWPLDESLWALIADRYVIFCTVLWLGIKIPVLAVPMLLFHALPFLIVRFCISVVPDGTIRIRRSATFYVLFCIAAFLALPAAVLVSLSYFSDCVVYYIFSVPYCALTNRWSQMRSGYEKIRPYRNGPSILQHLPDLFVCLVGQCGRQSPFEAMYMVSCMWLLMPWLKYFVNCNPWIYDLDHRLCQQISTEMQDLGQPDEVADTARMIISCARQQRKVAQRIDLWSFVPHYPLPPPTRRWALGLQAGGAKYPGKFTLIVHTTHAISQAGGSKEQFVLSNSCEEPIYRVMLWYSNPFHFLTGWVEASVSTGLPSQPNKRHGGEHPMWLVTGRSPLVAGRDSWTGSGMIDSFFDYWLPVFVHEMRRDTYSRKFQDKADGEALALHIADAKYQEVHSEDGVSRPIEVVGRKKYDTKDALSDFQRTAVEQHTYEAQWAAQAIASLADTPLGVKASEYLQDGDIDLGVTLEAVTSDPKARTVAKGAVGGAAALGTGGGVLGFASGSLVGAACGLPAALFTFGLSIPVGAAVGGGAGLCVGATAGSTMGFVGGAAAGGAYASKEEIGNSAHSWISGARQRASEIAASCKERVTEQATHTISSVSVAKRRLAASKTF